MPMPTAVPVADGKSWNKIGDFAPDFTTFGASAVSAPGLIAFTMVQLESEEEFDVESTISAWFAPIDRLTP